MITTQTAKTQLANKLGVKLITEGKPDYWLLALVVVLLILGTVMIYSASFVTAAAANDGNSAAILIRHVVWLAIGLFAMVVCIQVDYHSWRKFSIGAMVLVMVLLLAILVLPDQFAPVKYGAKRWINFTESLQFQPSEIAKLTLIVYAAHWLSSKGTRVRNLFYGLAPFAITIGSIIFLIMNEPDMGTSLVIGAIGLGMFFVAGANLLHLLSGAGLAVGVFWLLANAAPYRLERLKTFTDPLADPTGPGWHTYQALLGLGSGGVFGVGLGASRSKFFWLPTVYTDSIFAVIGEELGLVGTCLIVILFLVLAWRGFGIARHAPDGFGRLVATGVTIYIVFQAFLNMAVISNLIPFTGIPLPFISYGGSSLAVSMAAIGMLLNVSRQQVDNPRVLELAVERESERRQRDLLREQRAAEREKREALRAIQDQDKASKEAQDLAVARQNWEQRTAQEKADLAWREKLEQELNRQKQEEQARKQAQLALAQQRQPTSPRSALPSVAAKSFMEFNQESDAKDDKGQFKVRKPRRDWAKVYSNLANRNEGRK